MHTRVVVGVVLLAVGAARAEEPGKIEDVKRAVVGKWVSTDKDRIPLEVYPDGTIKIPTYTPGGKWVLVAGTYTVDAKGEIRYRAQNGGVTLGGWYKLKDGMLTSAKGPRLIVTWKKVADEKLPDRN